MARQVDDVDLAEALRGAFLVFENGRDLLEEAELLFASKRYARALSLAVLAIEEFGKLVRLLQIDRYQADPKLKKKFWEWFRDHKVKAGLNVLVTMGSRSDEQELSDDWHGQEGRNYHDLKMAAFYVDFVNGTFRAPQDIQSLEREAESLIALARASYESRREYMSQIDPETHWSTKAEIRSTMTKILNDPAALDAYLSGREDRPEAQTIRNLAHRMNKKLD